MARVLVVDDTPVFAGKIADDLRNGIGADVVEVHQLSELPSALTTGRFDVAIVDLSFPFQSPRSGLDALLFLRMRSPDTRCAVLTQGDEFVAEMVRDAWETLNVDTVLSKTRLAHTESVRSLLAGNVVEPDSDAKLLLPARRSPDRQLSEYRRLFPHRGLHRLWSSLIAIRNDVNPKSVAKLTATETEAPLSPNAVANYRQLVLSDLERHGLIHPTLIEMARFARRTRPFLLHAMGTPDMLDLQIPTR